MKLTTSANLNDKFEPEHRKNRIPLKTGQTFGSVGRTALRDASEDSGADGVFLQPGAGKGL
jgi:hypothetical protein